MLKSKKEDIRKNSDINTNVVIDFNRTLMSRSNVSLPLNTFLISDEYLPNNLDSKFDKQLKTGNLKYPRSN